MSASIRAELSLLRGWNIPPAAKPVLLFFYYLTIIVALLLIYGRGDFTTAPFVYQGF